MCMRKLRCLGPAEDGPVFSIGKLRLLGDLYEECRRGIKRGKVLLSLSSVGKKHSLEVSDEFVVPSEAGLDQEGCPVPH